MSRSITAGTRAFELRDGLTIEYAVRPSRGTRAVRLRITPGQGLVISVPPGVGGARLEEILREKARWIERHLTRMDGLAPPPGPPPSTIRPALLSLRAIDEDWQVDYEDAPVSGVALKRQPPQRLLVRGRVDDVPLCQTVLKRWLALRAREALGTWLADLAAQHDFTFSAVSIRAQRSRWGSCSARGAISLNLQLLFLPSELARYVLLHELCHTRVMSHSQRFWRLLERVEPESEVLRARMREATQMVPAWLGMGMPQAEAL